MYYKNVGENIITKRDTPHFERINIPELKYS